MSMYCSTGEPMPSDHLITRKYAVIRFFPHTVPNRRQYSSSSQLVSSVDLRNAMLEDIRYESRSVSARAPSQSDISPFRRAVWPVHRAPAECASVAPVRRLRASRPRWCAERAERGLFAQRDFDLSGRDARAGQTSAKELSVRIDGVYLNGAVYEVGDGLTVEILDVHGEAG